MSVGSAPVYSGKCSAKCLHGHSSVQLQASEVLRPNKNIMAKLFFCKRTLVHQYTPCFHDSVLLWSFLETVDEELSDFFVTLSVDADVFDLFAFFFIAESKGMRGIVTSNVTRHIDCVSIKTHNAKTYLLMSLFIATELEEKWPCLHNVELHVYATSMLCKVVDTPCGQQVSVFPRIKNNNS